MRRAFTLLELLMVIVIVGILATFAVPNYWRTHLRVLEREAQPMLSLIQAAERVRQLEGGSYLVCNSNTECNSLLSLELPTGSPYWNYTVPVTAGGASPGFCAEAAHAGGAASFHICTAGDPLGGGCGNVVCY